MTCKGSEMKRNWNDKFRNKRKYYKTILVFCLISLGWSSHILFTKRYLLDIENIIIFYKLIGPFSKRHGSVPLKPQKQIQE